jgi:hypothetical protein
MSESVCRCGGPLELRQRIDFGQRRVVRQCQTQSCGRIFRVPPRELREMDGAFLRDLPMLRRKATKRPNSKKRAYQAALHSTHWKKLRDQVLTARPRCERDGPGCTGVATELNHRHYDTLGHETPADVEASCRACNQDERTQRITRGVLGG